jgi:exopolysaccharide biosynthesis polyprenyl glycosylphosphotransferase
MRQKFQLLYNLSLVVSDCLAILAAFTIAYILRVQLDSRPLLVPISAKSYFLIYLAVLPFWISIMAAIGMYKRSFYHRFIKELSGTTLASIFGIMALITIDFAIDTPIFPARLVPLYALFLAIGLITFGRLSLRLAKYLAALSGRGLTRVLIIGGGDVSPDLYNHISARKNKEFRLEGIWLPYQIKNFSPSPSYKIGSLQAAINRIRDGHVDLVVQTEVLEDQLNQKLSLAVESAHISYKLIPSNSSLFGVQTSPDLFFGIPTLNINMTPLNGWNTLLKRLFDIILSLILLIFALPAMLIIAILIKLTDSSGPVFYRHIRVSRFGTKFGIIKFRSMYQKYCSGKKSNQQIFKEMGREDLLDEWQTTQKIKNDPRITPIGRFIRKTSLDELPQLLNVLSGKLSLIGPRAITKEELNKYKTSKDKFLSIKPGITGLWQVSGRNDLSYDDRVKLDIYYVQNWSIWLDVKILFKTVGTILKGDGR